MTPCCWPGQARRALSGLLHEGKQALKAKEVSAALLAAEQVCGPAFTIQRALSVLHIVGTEICKLLCLSGRCHSLTWGHCT